MQKLQQILTTPKEGRLPYLPPLIEIDEMESEGSLATNTITGDASDTDTEQGDSEAKAVSGFTFDVIEEEPVDVDL